MANGITFRRSRLEVTAEVDGLIFRFDSIGAGEMYPFLEGKGHFPPFSGPWGFSYEEHRRAAAQWMQENYPKFKEGQLKCQR